MLRWCCVLELGHRRAFSHRWTHVDWHVDTGLMCNKCGRSFKWGFHEWIITKVELETFPVEFSAKPWCPGQLLIPAFFFLILPLHVLLHYFRPSISRVLHWRQGKSLTPPPFVAKQTQMAFGSRMGGISWTLDWSVTQATGLHWAAGLWGCPLQVRNQSFVQMCLSSDVASEFSDLS